MFFGWIIFSFVVGFIGSRRRIGFWGAFLLSLLLSPLIGIIIALVSKNKDDEKYKETVLRVQRNQQQILEETLENLSNREQTNSISIIEELEKLKKLKEENLITEEEFLILKNKIINS